MRWRSTQACLVHTHIECTNGDPSCLGEKTKKEWSLVCENDIMQRCRTAVATLYVYLVSRLDTNITRRSLCNDAFDSKNVNATFPWHECWCARIMWGKRCLYDGKWENASSGKKVKHFIRTLNSVRSHRGCHNLYLIITKIRRVMIESIDDGGVMDMFKTKTLYDVSPEMIHYFRVIPPLHSSRLAIHLLRRKKWVKAGKGGIRNVLHANFHDAMLPSWAIFKVDTL